MLWRQVNANYEQLKEDAPEGYDPRVYVYVAGREEPVELGQVATFREPDSPWVAFSPPSALRQADPEHDKDKNFADDLLIFAHEGAILRVEVLYVKREPGARPAIGFSVT